MLIGASPLRKEDRRLLVGASGFLDDVRRGRTSWLGVVRSTHAHARVVGVHTKDALALPGVLGAWTAGDLPEITRPLAAPQKGQPFTIPVLVRDVVRYVGEPIAAVVADDPNVSPTGLMRSLSITIRCRGSPIPNHRSARRRDWTTSGRTKVRKFLRVRAELRRATRRSAPRCRR
jgi:CO/xanthine dehydrogenase Mo-binding subunit